MKAGWAVCPECFLGVFYCSVKDGAFAVLIFESFFCCEFAFVEHLVLDVDD